MLWFWVVTVHCNWVLGIVSKYNRCTINDSKINECLKPKLVQITVKLHEIFQWSLHWIEINRHSLRKIRQATHCQEIFAKDTSDKGLLLKIHKDLLKISNRDTNNPIKKCPKDLNGDLPHWRRHISGKSSYEKMFPTICQYGNVNSKSWYITTYLLEWPKYRILTIPNARRSGWECKMAQPPWKTFWQFLMKLNILLP